MATKIPYLLLSDLLLKLGSFKGDNLEEDKPICRVTQQGSFIGKSHYNIVSGEGGALTPAIPKTITPPSVVFFAWEGICFVLVPPKKRVLH